MLESVRKGFAVKKIPKVESLIWFAFLLWIQIPVCKLDKQNKTLPSQLAFYECVPAGSEFNTSYDTATQDTIAVCAPQIIHSFKNSSYDFPISTTTYNSFHIYSIQAL